MFNIHHHEPGGEWEEGGTRNQVEGGPMLSSDNSAITKRIPANKRKRRRREEDVGRGMKPRVSQSAIQSQGKRKVLLAVCRLRFALFCKVSLALPRSTTVDVGIGYSLTAPSLTPAARRPPPTTSSSDPN